MAVPMKKSRQRDAILQCVLAHHDHPTADTVYLEVRKDFPNISLGTVYRNLSLLTRVGKIRKISCDDRTDRFDGITAPHAHFICNSCGCLQDFPYQPDIHAYQEFARDFSGKIMECEVLFRGLCTECTEDEEIAEVSGSKK